MLCLLPCGEAPRFVLGPEEGKLDSHPTGIQRLVLVRGGSDLRGDGVNECRAQGQGLLPRPVGARGAGGGEGGGEQVLFS